MLGWIQTLFKHVSVGIIDTSRVGVEIKSYDKLETFDQHRFVQLVLPASGDVHVVVEAS